MEEADGGEAQARPEAGAPPALALLRSGGDGILSAAAPDDHAYAPAVSDGISAAARVANSISRHELFAAADDDRAAIAAVHTVQVAIVF